MISGMFSSTTIPVLEQVVNFAQARHNVLAGNIANFDTPGYQARDLSPEMFQTRLHDALRERDEMRAAGPISVAQTDPLEQVASAVDGMLYHDGTNNNLEKQVTEISKNELQHNLALSILTSQFRLLQAAVSERA